MCRCPRILSENPLCWLPSPLSPIVILCLMLFLLSKYFSCKCSVKPFYFFLSCVEELWLILIKPGLSFLFINVTLTSFLFISVALTVNLSSLIIKVDGNHCSVCGQIESHQLDFSWGPDSLMQALSWACNCLLVVTFLLLDSVNTSIPHFSWTHCIKTWVETWFRLMNCSQTPWEWKYLRIAVWDWRLGRWEII